MFTGRPINARMLEALNAQGEEAVTLWRQYTEESPDDAVGWLHLASAYAETRQRDAAMEAYATALKVDARWDWDYDQFGLALLNADYEEDGIRVYEDGVAREPDTATIHAGLANAYQRKQDWERVVAEYREAIRLEPDGEETGQWYESLGHGLEQLDLSDEAHEAYLAAVRCSPDAVYVHETLAESYWSRGEFAEAERELREYLRLETDIGNRHHATDALMRLLRRRGATAEADRLGTEALSEAEAVLEQRFQEGNTHWAELVRIAGVLEHFGEPEQAIGAYQRILDAHPTEPDTYRFLARALESAGRTDEAREISRQSIPLWRKYIEEGDKEGGWFISCGLWGALFDAGEYEEARLLAQNAVDAEPGGFSAWWCLGKTQSRMGRMAEAVDAFERARKLAEDEDNPGCNLNLAVDLGDAYDALGNRAQAEAAWRRGVEICREFDVETSPWLGDAQEKLAMLEERLSAAGAPSTE